MTPTVTAHPTSDRCTGTARSPCVVSMMTILGPKYVENACVNKLTGSYLFAYYDGALLVYCDGSLSVYCDGALLIAVTNCVQGLYRILSRQYMFRPSLVCYPITPFVKRGLDS